MNPYRAFYKTQTIIIDWTEIHKNMLLDNTATFNSRPPNHLILSSTHIVKKVIRLTSLFGGGEGGTFEACLTTKLLRRISVPAGGPSRNMTTFEAIPFKRNFPCN